MSENEAHRKKLAEAKGEIASDNGQPSFSNFLRSIEYLIDLVARMEQEGEEGKKYTRELSGSGGRLKGIFNFSVKLGLDEMLKAEPPHKLRRLPSNSPERNHERFLSGGFQEEKEIDA